MGKRAKSEGRQGRREHGQASPDRLLPGPCRVPHPRLRQLPPDQGAEGVGEEDGLDDLQGDEVVEEDDDENDENETSTNTNSSVFLMTASAPSVVISNGKPKVNPEDVTNTTCIRKGK